MTFIDMKEGLTMKKIKIEFSTDNSSFDDELWNQEVYCILKELADLAQLSLLTERNIKDSNGNTIGHYEEVEV